MINILIRTHNRPKMFDKCIKSIESQTYKDWRIIISADNKNAGRWAREYKYDCIRTDHMSQKSSYYARLQNRRRKLLKRPKRRVYWNLYFNSLQKKVTEGYVVYMDEDMVFYDENSLQIIADNSHEDELLIFRYQLPKREGTYARPVDAKWEIRPRRGALSTGCFSHHSKHPVVWMAVKAGDYFAARNLYDRLDSRWIKEIITRGQDD